MQSDAEVPQTDVEVPENDVAVPENDVAVPENDVEAPSDDVEVPEDDGGGCSDLCVAEEVQCNTANTAIEACSTGSSGCLEWQVTTDCSTTATPQCVDDGTTATCAADCSGVGPDIVCGAGDNTYKTDMCGNATTKKSTCSASLPCEVNTGDGQGYCSCQLTGENECKLGGALSTLYEETYIQKERKCTNNVPEPTDFIEDCGFGTVCFHEPEFNGGVPLCHRSIDASQAGKAYYDYGCGKFSMWLRNPTKLEIDCRCRITGDGQGGAGGTIGDGNGYVDPTTDPPYYPGAPIINCAPSYKMAEITWPVKYGEGPSFNAWFQQNSSGASWFNGGFDPDTREMYSIVKWTNPNYVKSGTVVAWNIDTHDRRVISGMYPGPAGQVEYGSGYMSPPVGNTGTVTEQPLSGAHVLRVGADKMIYTYGGGTGESTSATREIVRIDPKTGERTLMWLAQNPDTGDITGTWAGQCFRPDAFGAKQSVGLQSHGFEIGPDGTFYLSYRGIREGDGIISISADGQKCTFLSGWGGVGDNPGGGIESAPAPAPIGAGPVLQFPVQGLLLHEGLVYGVSNDEMYSFDPVTGDRVLKTTDNKAYGGMGFTNMFWDPTREVIWAVGTVAKYVGSIVDLTTGRREPVYGDSEWGDEAIMKSNYGTAQSVSTTMLTNGNTINYGGVILDPTNNDIVYAVLKSGGLMMMELSTFNNFVVSW